MTQAPNTELTIRVQAKGGMFLGPDSYNGAIITIRDGSTILSGPAFTDNGDSGTRCKAQEPDASPYPIITPGSQPPNVHWVVASDKTVKYTANLSLTGTTILAIDVRVPLPAAQGDQSRSVNLKLSPGPQPRLPGFVIEVPGLWVQPEIAVAGNVVNLKTKVTMMCGCEINPVQKNDDWPWLPSDFDVRAQIYLGEHAFGPAIPLHFILNSQFAGFHDIRAPGNYVAEITATQKSIPQNTGKARMSFQIPGVS